MSATKLTLWIPASLRELLLLRAGAAGISLAQAARDAIARGVGVNAPVEPQEPRRDEI